MQGDNAGVSRAARKRRKTLDISGVLGLQGVESRMERDTASTLHAGARARSCYMRLARRRPYHGSHGC